MSPMASHITSIHNMCASLDAQLSAKLVHVLGCLQPGSAEEEDYRF